MHDKSVQTVEVSSSILSFGESNFYPAFRRVFKGWKRNSFELWGIFHAILPCETSRQSIYKDQLYASAWDSETIFRFQYSRKTIYRLRKKLGPDPRHPIYIKTIIQVGYINLCRRRKYKNCLRTASRTSNAGRKGKILFPAFSVILRLIQPSAKQSFHPCSFKLFQRRVRSRISLVTGMGSSNNIHWSRCSVCSGAFC